MNSKNYLENFEHVLCPLDTIRKEKILTVLFNESDLNIDSDTGCKLLPEIVLRYISPRDTLNVLISFLLRFGDFHTELDLFSSSNLIDSFIYANLVNHQSHYTENDVDRLVDVYLMYDMRFQPGGVLSFSSKLMLARNAFSRLMNVNFSEHFPCPTVSIEDCHSQAMQKVEIYMKQTQLAMLHRIQQLNLPNCQMTHLACLLIGNQNWLEMKIETLIPLQNRSLLSKKLLLHSMINTMDKNHESSNIN